MHRIRELGPELRARTQEEIQPSLSRRLVMVK